MLEKKLSKLIPISGLVIAFYSVQRYSSFPIGNTFIWWSIHILILVLFFLVVRYSTYSREELTALRFVKWYLLWNVFSIVRGVFVADIYWDYKGLLNMGMALLMPVVAYLAFDKNRVQDILAFFIRYALPLSVLVFPFLPVGAWGWYLFPVGMLMLFFPALSIRAKIMVLLITLIAGFGDLGTRSHVLKYSMPVVLILFFYTIRNFSLSVKVMKTAQRIMIIIPLLFFVLAFTGTFEIFKMNEYISGEYVEKRKNTEGEEVQEDLKADTRTFLYVEVLQSAEKYNYWLIGRSPARGNETFHFADFEEEITGRPERLRNEVGILNTFTWTGIIGVFLFFLVFYQASFLAVCRSNNIYIKLVGLFVAFRWVNAWIEDSQAFDMNSFVIWLMVGICLSPSFRAMKDAEIKLWLWGIFERKYYQKYKYYTQREFRSSSRKLELN
ncbi:hypothetical protein [uncultured Sunxiuqinia sp.]|uniref:hypothetical protein n=1 Tax=uncultured Sunxiuqinia sp. TaxID=1573825 RepID=UPI002615A720|nr:hypothetical protein [uncultured Sunxiuqinia sp.]